MESANYLKWALLATLGWTGVACGGATTLPGGDGDGDGDGGGSTGGSSNQDGAGGTTNSGGGTGGVFADGGSAGAAGSAGSAGAPGGGAGSSADETACTNPEAEVMEGEFTGFVDCDEGYRHREEVRSCPNLLVPGDGPEGDFFAADECLRNLDCGGEKDYCELIAGFDFEPYRSCFAGCTDDSDCAQDEICECGPKIGTCIPAHCESDADCAEGQLCATDDDPGCGNPIAYACTLPDDECRDERDCETGACSAASGMRECVGLTVCGRPFLVVGKNRVAEVTRGSGFSGDALGVFCDSLSTSERQQVAAHYLKIAQMEHASIAAFARFTLQLLALGSPAHLVEASTSAQRDEARHAKLCFRLAAEYAGFESRPGELRLDGALEEISIEEILRLCVLEGCIGEATAALEVTQASRRASDPRLRAELERVAHDELQHAALAFRFVAWGLDRHPELTSMVRELFADHERSLRRRQPTAVPLTESERRLRAHGVLPKSESEGLTRAAFDQIIQPSIRALFAQLKQSTTGADTGAPTRARA